MWVQLSFELFYLYTYLLFLFPIAMHKQKSKGSQSVRSTQPISFIKKKKAIGAQICHGPLEIT